MYASAEFAAPRSGQTDKLPQRQRDRLWQRIRALRHCTLTTRTPYGEPHSRSVRLQNRSLGAGEPLWFFIERGSDLVLDVNADPQVVLQFTDRDGSRLCIDGRASVVGSLDEAAFKASVGGWFLPSWCRHGDTRHLALLRVDIEHVRQLPARSSLEDPRGIHQQELAFG